MTQKKPVKDYSTYSEFLGLVFQMFFIILTGAISGQYLDEYLLGEDATPWFTIILSFSSLMLALYLMIKKSTPKR